MNLPEIPATVREAIKMLSEEQRNLLFKQLKNQINDIPSKLEENRDKSLIEPENPWLKLAGKYQNDPQYDEVLAYIEKYRRELDSQTEDSKPQLPEKVTVK